jgi:hypothetical protein
MDLAGTLGISKETPVGSRASGPPSRSRRPEPPRRSWRSLRRKTEQYCVVFQTLVRPPRLETEWA